MENIQPKVEHEPAPKDISAEFLSMSVFEFMDFLRTQQKEPSLSRCANSEKIESVFGRF